MKQLAVTAVSLVLAAVAALAHIGEAIVSFTDIPPAAWYTQAVGYVQNEGLMLGTGDRKFSPNSTMTRAMLITVLYRQAGSPEPAAASGFNDVVKNSYYEKAVSWAAETGVTAGVGNGKFGVNDPVTREQLATFLWRRAGCPAVDNAVQIFHDADQISEFAFTAVHWAREQRIASGKGNDHFDPKGTATRAEAAVMLKNWLMPSSGPADSPEAAAPVEVTFGRETIRGFQFDNVYHSETEGEIHFGMYVPEHYDGTKPYALFVTLPGYGGLYFQGVGANLRWEDFGVEAQKYNSEMIVIAPQLHDWGNTSARQALALIHFILEHYNIDRDQVYLEGYSGGGETGSLVMESEPELFSAFLMVSSQWDGDLAPVAAARTPVYLATGREDSYYGSSSIRQAYSRLCGLYREMGLQEAEIDRLVVLDLKEQSYFDERSVQDQHAGGGLFAHDEAIMGWLFARRKTETDGNTVFTAAADPKNQQVLYLWEEGNAPAVTNYTVNNGGYFDDPEFRPTVTTFPVPEGTPVKGAVLICAGGAFQFRSDQMEGTPVARELSRLGYQSFVVDYRLRPYTQEEGALDLARAVRFVRKNANIYGIDEKDIGVMGFSAGGILAGEMVLNYRGNVSPAQLDRAYHPDSLDAVSADAGAVGMIYSFYGRLSVASTDVEKFRRSSLPPTYFCYGTRDPFYGQFEDCVEALRQAEVQVETDVLQDRPHGYGYTQGWIPAYAQWLERISEAN